MYVYWVYFRILSLYESNQMGEDFFDNTIKRIESDWDFDNSHENLDSNPNNNPGTPETDEDSEKNNAYKMLLNKIWVSEDQLIKIFGEDKYKAEIVPILEEHPEEIEYQLDMFEPLMEEEPVNKNEAFWNESNEDTWNPTEEDANTMWTAKWVFEPLQVKSINGINSSAWRMEGIWKMDAAWKLELIIQKIKNNKQIESLNDDNQWNIDMDSVSFMQEIFITTETKGITANIQNYLLNPQNKGMYLEFKKFYSQNISKDQNDDFWKYNGESILDNIKTNNISINDIKFSRTYFKYLESLGQNLSKEQIKQKGYLIILFKDLKNHTIVYNRRNKLLERRSRPRLLLKAASTIPESKDVVSWDLSSLRPQDIIRSNNSIKRYIFWPNQNPEDLLWEKPENINSVNDIKWDQRKDIFNKVIWKKPFNEFKNFFDNLWNLVLPNDNSLTENDIITLKRVEKDVHDNMVHLARIIQFSAKRKEVHGNVDGKIHERAVRASCMICCIRAITSYFDTVNNNWENFAGLFKIDDINKNVEFKEDDKWGWILSMEWSINWRHLKIYYDTTRWTISFDKFLWKDNSNDFVIWKNNGQREEVITWLPTMQNLTNSAEAASSLFEQNIPANLRPRSRAKISTFLMTKHIWHKQFLTLDFGINRDKVKEFNEKNLLTQEILYNIYGHYYDESVVEEIFNWESNGDEEPNNTRFIVKKGSKQYEMIQLINNSIEHYKDDANALMRFRNCIEDLHDILEIINSDSWNNTLIPKSRQEDEVLRNFFIDDRNNPNDEESVSNHIMSMETWKIAWDFSSVYTRSIVHNNIENEDSRNLNYHAFLCLLSRNTFVGSNGNISNEDSFVDIDEFETIINHIRGGWNNISNYVNMNKNNPDSIFAQNYIKYKERQDKQEADDLLANSWARD